MNEIRQNKATGQWVIFAAGRGRRPHDLRPEPGERDHLPEVEEGCPFCPGNEKMQPSVIAGRTGPGRVADPGRSKQVPCLDPGGG